MMNLRAAAAGAARARGRFYLIWGRGGDRGEVEWKKRKGDADLEQVEQAAVLIASVALLFVLALALPRFRTRTAA